MDHIENGDEIIDLGDARVETKGPPDGDKHDLIGASRVGTMGLTNE